MPEFKRPTLPTGEYSGIAMEKLTGKDIPVVAYDYEQREDLAEEFAERDTTLDPQYIWRGKVKSDLNRLETKAPIIYQQEVIYPRMLIEEMKRHTAWRRNQADAQLSFDAYTEEFDPDAQPTFYNHEQKWKNRLILGDSLQVMASLAENESLRGKVQMIYMDPPYGIKFNSNWQPSTKSTNVKDGSVQDITREPEMVKAFRDTWHDGVHSYLGYLRDRLIVARDLLAETGSCFVQIGDANVHKVRAVMDEVFGEKNFVSQITYASTIGLGGERLSNATNYILWFAKNVSSIKYRPLYKERVFGGEGSSAYKKLELPTGERLSIADWEKKERRVFSFADITKLCCRVLALADITSANHGRGVSEGGFSKFLFEGKYYTPGVRTFTTHPEGMERLTRVNRVGVSSKGKLGYIRYFDDFAAFPLNNIWMDTLGQNQFGGDKIYVVQTGLTIIQRCMLMCTDPGDIVLDPTCGSGTTAYVAEQWGRRWITIDTSRVAVALARRRLMGAKFPYYLLADSEEGLKKESEVTGKLQMRPTYNKVSQGFVYERVPHITLKSIANNPEIDLIWEKYVAESLRLREELKCSGAFKEIPEEWEVPFTTDDHWPEKAKTLHAQFLELKRKRQSEMDESIARNAETEFLYDKPYENKKKVRVTGPFTVESVAPVRALIAQDDGDPIDPTVKMPRDLDYGNGPNYISRMLKLLGRNGVKQAKKGDRIQFASLIPNATLKDDQGGHIHHIHAIALTSPEETSPNAKSQRYAIYIGPEFGSVTRAEQKAAEREAQEQGCDVLLVCAFNFEAYVEEGNQHSVGGLKVLHARMNSDLHMAATDLKDTGSGNPFVIFGEPEIELQHREDDTWTVEIKSVYVYDPKTGNVRSDNADAIDCWMLDTDYNEEAFFARQVFFPGKDKVFEAFKKFLKDDIDEEEWSAVSKTVSLPFTRPSNGLIAVKVINHFGDEVMKIFKVQD